MVVLPASIAAAVAFQACGWAGARGVREQAVWGAAGMRVQLFSLPSVRCQAAESHTTGQHLWPGVTILDSQARAKSASGRD